MTTTTADIWPTFDDWWDLYDNKLDRMRCEKLWAKMSQQDKEKAMQHTERYVKASYLDGRFPTRRNPGTYLQNHNWHDEALIRTLIPATNGAASNEQYTAGTANAAADLIARRRAQGRGGADSHNSDDLSGGVDGTHDTHGEKVAG